MTEAKLPAIAPLNQRLAARYHQRQAWVLARAQAVADAIAADYRRIAGEIAEWAARAGLVGMARVRDALDRALAQRRARLADGLLQFGFDAHDRTVATILTSIPQEWLPFFVEMVSARLPEAGAVPEPPDWVADYQLDPAARRAVGRDEAMRLVRALLFPQPTREEVEGWLTQAVPGGKTWEERLKSWAEPTRQAILNELILGLSGEPPENVDGLRARLEPYTGGLAYKAQRIARTEAGRVAERANRAAIDEMGDLVQGQQVIAVMDEWTRPEHAARNGRIYRRQTDGTYRDELGNPLPDLPDAPNCRCTTIPVLRMPNAFRRDPALRAQFETASGKLIPDPASYMDWWERAGGRERMTAVGVKRYQTVRDMLGRDPEWIDFLGTDGQLLSIDALRRENPAQRDERRMAVRAVLDARQRMFRAVASRTYPLGPRLARPQATISVPMLRGGLPHEDLLQGLEMGDPKRASVLVRNEALVRSLAQELFGQPVGHPELAPLAGALDDADVLVSMEEGGLRLEMHRRGVRAVRWVGPDYAGVLKLELVRMDVPEHQRRLGLATRSLARTIQQASMLGVQYADATAVRSTREAGYYHLPRLGFDAELPADWLESHRQELAALGIAPVLLSELFRTEAGRDLWRVHGRTLDVRMDLRAGSVDMWRMVEYLRDRTRKGRTMAESQSKDRSPEPPPFPMFCNRTGILWTEEDEAIMDEVWAKYPITPEERQRKLEFYRRIRPGTRGQLSEEQWARIRARAAEYAREDQVRQEPEAQQ